MRKTNYIREQTKARHWQVNRDERRKIDRQKYLSDTGVTNTRQVLKIPRQYQKESDEVIPLEHALKQMILKMWQLIYS